MDAGRELPNLHLGRYVPGSNAKGLRMRAEESAAETRSGAPRVLLCHRRRHRLALTGRIALRSHVVVSKGYRNV